MTTSWSSIRCKMCPTSMPKDNGDGQAPVMVGRTYSGEAAPPITTPQAAVESRDRRAVYAGKDGAVHLDVYFASRGIDNPILRASMAAYTDINVATHDDFDVIFARHHGATVSDDVGNKDTKGKRAP